MKRISPFPPPSRAFAAARASLLLLAAATIAAAQTIELVPVTSKPISRTIDLPGELQPFLSVPVHAKVRGYVERMLVDRGSAVKQGDLLAELSAPEMKAQIAEAQSRVAAADADRQQAEAALAGVQSTYDKLKKANETQGAISGNELTLAEKQVDAARALVQSKRQSVAAAQSAVAAQKEMEAYLRITAPFAGIVTDRFVHPGALVGPSADPALLVLQQVARLRLIVAVPEESVAGTTRGTAVEFRVPAYPERVFKGSVARIAHALDQKARAMSIELDVSNGDGALSPGMYPAVKWPVRRAQPSMFVPKSAIVTTTERTFVVRETNGKAQWVNVKKGSADGDLQEVMGDLKPGDKVVKRATDEIREGNVLQK